jgi:hypothetical protein
MENHKINKELWIKKFTGRNKGLILKTPHLGLNTI